MIDLSTKIDALSDDDRMVLDAASAFCSSDSECHRVRVLRGTRPSFDRQVWGKLAEMGWLGCRLPENLGGMPLTYHQLTLLLEQYGRSLMPEPLTAAVILAGGALYGGTNEALKEHWLPQLVRGTWIPSLAWQEYSGHPATEPLTRTTRQGERYVLNGEKRFVAIAECADAFIVSAAGDNGCGLYLVERDAPGLTITTHPRIDGGTWSDLTFAGVSVCAGNVVADGPTASIALERVLDEARLAVSAELVGLMARVLELSAEYITIRQQFDKPIGSFQALQHRAADMYILTELSRSVLRQSAALFDATEYPDPRARAASQAKARTSDAALKVAKAAVQLHGGIAYTDECNIGLFLKRAMVQAAWLGSSSKHRARYGNLAEAAMSKGTTGTRDTENLLQQEVRTWVAENFPAEWRFPITRMSLVQTASWQKKLSDKGWIAPAWPKEYGGMGLTAYDQLKMQEAFDRHGISIVPNLGMSMLGPLLIRYGSESQRAEYLPKILSGETKWCQGYSEPGAGSDLANIRTSAVLDGDEFVVNGQKTWTSHAKEADMIFMLVRTDPHVKKQEGISFLLADMRTPGISVRRILNLAGDSEFCEVFFDNVRVPKANLVGDINKGWMMAKSLLGSERIMVGSPKLARYPLQLLRSLLHSRGVFDDPVVRTRYDELRLDVEDHGAAFVRMVDVLRRGGELGPEVSILKIWITETMQRVTDFLLEVSGDGGTLDESLMLSDGASVHVANQYFMSRPTTIYGGTSEIQRNIIAKALLNLPG